MGNQYDSREASEAYDRSEKIRKDGIARAESMNLAAGTKVLDIGSGPGVLALPLARLGCRVTAVEPSGEMRRLLRQHLEEENLQGVKILPYTWEEVPEEELEDYDRIVASYSLYMEDFGEAVRKMNRHSGGKVELYWFAGETSWERDRRLLSCEPGKDSEKKVGRKIDTLYQSLYDMGIYADITMLTDTSFDREYDSFRAAVEDMQKRYKITDAELPILERYLERRLKKQGNLWYYRDLTHYAKLSWNVPEREEEA